MTSLSGVYAAGADYAIAGVRRLCHRRRRLINHQSSLLNGSVASYALITARKRTLPLATFSYASATSSRGNVSAITFTLPLAT